jgi:hypothetical protein
MLKGSLSSQQPPAVASWLAGCGARPRAESTSAAAGQRGSDVPDAGDADHGLVKVLLLVDAVGRVEHGLEGTTRRSEEGGHQLGGWEDGQAGLDEAAAYLRGAWSVERSG